MAAQEGYVEITVTIDGVQVFENFYEDGEELAAEAFREGIMLTAKHVTNELEMFVQYHPHDSEVKECICAQMESSNNRWSNSKGAV